MNLFDIKKLLGIESDDTSSDEQINILISECTNFVKAYCGFKTDDEYPCEGEFKKAEYIVSRMVRELYTNLGSEGISSKEYGNIKETYESGKFSHYVTVSLNSFRRLKTPSSNR